jgi:hypothetical protein
LVKLPLEVIIPLEIRSALALDLDFETILVLAFITFLKSLTSLVVIAIKLLLQSCEFLLLNQKPILGLKILLRKITTRYSISIQ